MEIAQYTFLRSFSESLIHEEHQMCYGRQKFYENTSYVVWMQNIYIEQYLNTMKLTNAVTNIITGSSGMMISSDQAVSNTIMNTVYE